jgi:hypothetical protein
MAKQLQNGKEIVYDLINGTIDSGRQPYPTLNGLLLINLIF